MTLDDMEAKAAYEVQRDRERDEKFEKWNHKDLIGKVPVVQSFFCENNHHADCRWAECKCVCHDSAEWCGWGMC